MSDVILKVENVSKLYRLGTVGTGTFGGDVQRFWKTKILGQEDPFLKIGQTNDRTSKEKADFVWALQNINFEVKRGEVLGIIGKNGAGKSTLLKLLSRITSPTTGSIKSAGRMASLLEVGTGFHPELTGRENIYLNGAILGMTKKEIQRKFDEIVDFSGCELYIDTPTKRYSSGMTVRLGFAVAAFLDPEILVVDEVLAVGDAEFQRKAIGKMQDVSTGEGRTVLFVSHNMESIVKLCPNTVLIENGQISKIGKTSDVINRYFSKDFKNRANIKLADVIIKDNFYISNFYVNNQSSQVISVNQGDDWNVKFVVNKFDSEKIDFYFNIELKTTDGTNVGCFGNEFQKKVISIEKNSTIIEINLGIVALKKGEYIVNVYFQLGYGSSNISVYHQDYILFNVNSALRQSNNWTNYINQPQHGHAPILWNNINII